MATVTATAPLRVCDLGGWTDTWFGGPGRLVNIAVRPGTEVRVDAVPGGGTVTIEAPGMGDVYDFVPGSSVGRHPILEAAVNSLPPAAGLDIRIRATSAHPPGCGTGTSASITVAMLGALHGLRGDPIDPDRIAAEAHHLETGLLGRQSGVQDHIAAVHGGISYIEIDRYPEAAVTRLSAWDELEAGLLLVYVGHPHDSSGIHRRVIDGAGPERQAALQRLREAARAGRQAIEGRDMRALGLAAVANTDAQRALHPGLVGTAATALIEVASAAGACGWKVNGAGGDGGSVTLLVDQAQRSAVREALRQADAGFRDLPIIFSPGGLMVRRDDRDATMNGREGAQ